eukprot:scaffold232776_cov28-Tisochrysis_lutea.AAC.2
MANGQAARWGEGATAVARGVGRHLAAWRLVENNRRAGRLELAAEDIVFAIIKNGLALTVPEWRSKATGW